MGFFVVFAPVIMAMQLQLGRDATQKTGGRGHLSIVFIYLGPRSRILLES